MKQLVYPYKKIAGIEAKPSKQVTNAMNSRNRIITGQDQTTNRYAMIRAILTCLCLVMLVLPAQQAMAMRIAGSQHDLSATSSHPIRAQSERRICEFCHTPHTKGKTIGPMWNRNNTGNTYEPYWSTTMDPISPVGQPNGSSILCLSCHDGTIALGEVIKRDTRGTEIAMTGARSLSGRSSSLGLELRDDHPISFAYTSELATQRGKDPVLMSGGNELKQPVALPRSLRLDNAGRLQCTTCHNSHDNELGNFLVMSNRGTDAPYLCTACHEIEAVNEKWSESAHKNSAKATSGSRDKHLYPYTLMDENGCQNCHTPHGASFSAGATGASNKSPLLYHASSVDNCIPCHRGQVAEKNIDSETDKTSNHPMDNSEIHDPRPGTVSNEPYQLSDTDHVVCVDCHNPHAANADDFSTEPYLPGTLRGVKGIDISGNPKKPITEIYELCFRCHGDGATGAILHTPRVIEQTNTRLEFQQSNPSFHPVAFVGKNTSVPSLDGATAAPAYLGSDIMSCTDCHNNEDAPTYSFATDRGRGDGSGMGPRGPHGTDNRPGNHTPILLRRYEKADNTSESEANYSLCYYCHNRNSILNDDSFKGHKTHIQDYNTPCNVCHDPHGISNTQATITPDGQLGCSTGGGCPNNTHLINFDTSVVTPSNGQLGFVDTGTQTGSCYMNCHGRDHNPETY